MKTIGTTQRRIRNRDRVKGDRSDFHTPKANRLALARTTAHVLQLRLARLRFFALRLADQERAATLIFCFVQLAFVCHRAYIVALLPERYLEVTHFFMGHLVRCWLLFAGLFAGSPIVKAPDRSTIDRTMAELAAVTGFQLHHPVTFQVLTRPEVNRFLQDRIKEAVKPAEIRAEELTLKKFGFVPADFDLKQTTVALLTEQTAAFYDYHRKRLFLTDWTSRRLRDAATAHELAHALADQNYPLERFAKGVERDSEQAAARQAVVEGQATWLMRDLLERHPEPNGTAEPDPPSEVFDRAPLYLRDTLTFPYNYGTGFQQAVYARFGKDGFRIVFEQPPVSTQQILHPDLYFSGTKPVQVPLPSLRKMRRLVDGPLGELEHSILLRQFTTDADAREVSPEWRGAHYQLWEDRKTDRVALVYRSVWATEQAADRFFQLYKQVLRHKWKQITATKDSNSRFAGTSEDGYFTVDRVGMQVTSREGLASL